MTTKMDLVPAVLSTKLDFVSEIDGSVLFSLKATGSFTLQETITVDAQQGFYFNFVLNSNATSTLNVTVDQTYKNFNISLLTSLINDNIKLFLAKNPYLLFSNGIKLSDSISHYLGTKYVENQGFLILGDNLPHESQVVVEKKIKFLS